MKYKIKLSKDFKKAFKKLAHKDALETLNVIELLANDEPLEPKHRDHKLQGNYKNCRECHIKPDLLLIYQKHENELILACVNLGSHSDLF